MSISTSKEIKYKRNASACQQKTSAENQYIADHWRKTQCERFGRAINIRQCVNFIYTIILCLVVHVGAQRCCCVIVGRCRIVTWRRYHSCEVAKIDIAVGSDDNVCVLVPVM